MQNKEKRISLSEIIKKKIINFSNQFEKNSLYLRNEKITPAELSELTKKKVGDIVSFF
jgi:hypothetical protein